MRIPESAIPVAAFIFESLKGVSLGTYELGEIDASGIGDVDPELLARELRYLITKEHKGDSRDRQQAYWALGKKQDPDLIPFFREQLRLEVRRDMIAAYQIMIALQDIGETTFHTDRSSYSYDEYELNRLDAQRYIDGLDSSK